MKARMEVTLDTIWTNQVTASVECELDNPHVLSAQHLAEMMVHRLKYLVGEIREANVRAIPDIESLDEERPVEERPAGERHARTAQHETLAGESERERQAYEDMRQEKDETSIFQERRSD